MTRNTLKEKLANNEFIVAPGIQDMIAAVVANKVGFEFVYASGYWSVASAYGLPDAGIASYTQVLDRVEMLCKTSNAKVIADADTGYGGLLNVHHTVRGFEAAGVCAIQLEDQEFPKKCGHTPRKRVVPKDDMLRKIEVACEARSSTDTLIIARTDAKQPEGFDRALERAIAYGDAGADVVFVEALDTIEEMEIACQAVKQPMLANMANGGRSPILDVEALNSIGFSMAIFPAMTSLAAAFAMESALTTLKQSGASLSDDTPHFSFAEFNELIGFPDVWAFDAKWAAQSGDQ